MAKTTCALLHNTDSLTHVFGQIRVVVSKKQFRAQITMSQFPTEETNAELDTYRYYLATVEVSTFHTETALNPLRAVVRNFGNLAFLIIFTIPDSYFPNLFSC